MDEEEEACRCVRCPFCESYDVAGASRPDISQEILFWQCEECSARWHRHSPESDLTLYRLAAVFINL